MRITTQGGYGIRCLVRLARHREERQVPISELAEKEGLSKEYVEQLMLRLRRAGIVSSTRGVHGGYRLAADPAEVTFRRVLEVLEGKTFEVICERIQSKSEEECVNVRECSMRPVWFFMQQVLNTMMEAVTLQDVIGKSRDELNQRLQEMEQLLNERLEMVRVS